jgi:outer membrane biosynthesis protein TonB
MRKLPYILFLAALLLIPLILLAVVYKNFGPHRGPSSLTKAESIVTIEESATPTLISLATEGEEAKKEEAKKEEPKKEEAKKEEPKKEEAKKEEPKKEEAKKEEPKKEEAKKEEPKKEEAKKEEPKKEEAKKEEPKKEDKKVAEKDNAPAAPIKRKDRQALARAYQQEVELNDTLVGIMFQNIFSMMSMMMEQQYEMQSAFLAQQWTQPLANKGWEDYQPPITVLNRNYHLYAAPDTRNWDQYYYQQNQTNRQNPSIFSAQDDLYGEMKYYSPDLVDPRMDDRERNSRKNIFHEFPAPAQPQRDPANPPRELDQRALSVIV